MNNLTKLTISLTTILFLQSCGVVNHECGNSIRMGCNTVFGKLPNDGDDGKNGKDGVSCSVIETISGATITCGDVSVSVDDGADGADGVDGVDGTNATINPYSVTEIVDPCGDHAGHFDEVLLKMYNGDIVAYFKDNGSREFLTIIGAGNYQTTDKQKCNFSVDSNRNITW